jgi:hypothetical protein
MPSAASCCSFLWFPWGLRKIGCDRSTVPFRSLGITQVFSGLRCFPSRCRHFASFLLLLISQSYANEKRNCSEDCAFPVDEVRNRWMAVHNLRCNMAGTGARGRPRVRSVPLGLFPFIELTPDLRPGLTYVAPSGLGAAVPSAVVIPGRIKQQVPRLRMILASRGSCFARNDKT